MHKNTHNITIISHSFPSEEMPVNGVFVKDQADWLSMYYKINIIAPRPKTTALLSKVRKKWGQIHRIPPESYYNNYKVLRPQYLTFPKKFFYKLAGVNFTHSVMNNIAETDIVHVHFAYPGATTIPVLKKRYPQSYFVLTIHGNDWYLNIKNKNIEKKIYEALSMTNKIVVVGDKLKLDISKAYPEFSSKIEVINNGVDFSKLKKGFSGEIIKKNDNILNILMVGAYAEGKGLHVLLKALSIAKIPFYKLYVIGNIISDKYYHKMQKLSVELGINENVSFLTAQSRSVLCQYYEQCDFFVLPSLSEGFGISIVEAMSFGKPVLSTKSGGPQGIVNESNGRLVEPNDSMSLAKGIEQMAKIYSDFDNQKITDDIKQKYNYSNVGKKLIKIYETS